MANRSRSGDRTHVWAYPRAPFLFGRRPGFPILYIYILGGGLKSKTSDFPKPQNAATQLDTLWLPRSQTLRNGPSSRIRSRLGKQREQPSQMVKKHSQPQEKAKNHKTIKQTQSNNNQTNLDLPRKGWGPSFGAGLQHPDAEGHPFGPGRGGAMDPGGRKPMTELYGSFPSKRLTHFSNS